MYTDEGPLTGQRRGGLTTSPVTGWPRAQSKDIGSNHEPLREFGWKWDPFGPCHSRTLEVKKSSMRLTFNLTAFSWENTGDGLRSTEFAKIKHATIERGKWRSPNQLDEQNQDP